MTRGINKFVSTIIVPILQEIDIFDLFLESLAKNLLPQTQIIFINDGSGSLIDSRIRRFEKLDCQHNGTSVEMIRHDHPKGCSSSINEALRLARADYIFFVDSDIILQGNWQQSALSTFSMRKNIGIVGSVLLYPQTGGIQHCGLVFSNGLGRHLFLNGLPSCLPKKPFSTQAVVFAMCAIKRKVFEKVGYLDENYFNGYEDLDYQMRARQAGFDIVVNPEIILYHWERSSGIHRTTNRKKNIGTFWKQWGSQIEEDLWNFIQLGLTNYSNIIPGNKVESFIGIDLAEVRVDAKQFWGNVMSLNYFQINRIIDLSFRVNYNGAIWLPQVLGKDFFRYPQRFLILVDNFCRLMENRYWIELRSNVRNDDLVVDLYGNVFEINKLSEFCWPGSKIR